MSAPSVLSVFYVFGTPPVPAGAGEAAAGALAGADGVGRADPVVILYDCEYEHAVGEIGAAVRRQFDRVVVPTMQRTLLPAAAAAAAADSSSASAAAGDPSRDGHHVVRVCGFDVVLPAGTLLKDCRILFIGAEVCEPTRPLMPPGLAGAAFLLTHARRRAQGPRLTSALLRSGGALCVSYDPATCLSRLEGAGVNRAFARRFHGMQRVRAAGVIGIVVGTLTVAK